MRWHSHHRWGMLTMLCTLLGATPASASRLLIPAFARKYRTGCSTCHTAAPKLNVLGEAFRLNGYQLPDNAALVRREPPVPLGEDPWKDLWPRAIWPGELPGSAPLAVRIQSDALVQRVAPSRSRVRLLMPYDVYVLAGATLGGGISAFAEAEWEREGGVELLQAKVLFQDPLRFLPRRSLNFMVGRQNLVPLTLGDRVIDGAGRREFAWQQYHPDGTALGGVAGSGTWRIGDAMPALTANGLLGGRLFYSVGMAQVSSEDEDEGGRPLAGFYTVRYKWGGLRLDGRYDRGGGPRPHGNGQLLDRAVILETFGYRGREALDGGGTDHQLAAGVAVRVLNGPLDVGAGLVSRRDTGAWPDDRSHRAASAFAKAEYLVFPWLIGSLKGERFRLPDDGSSGVADESTIVPGAVMLLRQNVRLVVEGELYGVHVASSRDGQPRPHALAVRLDLAF